MPRLATFYAIAVYLRAHRHRYQRAIRGLLEGGEEIVLIVDANRITGYPVVRQRLLDQLTIDRAVFEMQNAQRTLRAVLCRPPNLLEAAR